MFKFKKVWLFFPPIVLLVSLLVFLPKQVHMFWSCVCSKSFIILPYTFYACYYLFMVKEGVQFLSFTYVYLVVLKPNVEKTVFSPLNCLGILIKSKLTINVITDFWTLNAIPLSIFFCSLGIITLYWLLFLCIKF